MASKPRKTQKGNGNGGSPATETDKGLLVTGIGASAGGVQALKEFFTNASSNAGIAYVVILHLSPDFDSQLAEVLQQVTKMPVAQVTERVRVEPDHIYVVPPDRHLTMEDGYVNVSQNVEVEDRRAPVDIFFRTLAESHGHEAVAVILSGSGANGSMGLKRIKERGGAVFVQDPREAEYSDMPRNSIATKLIDQVLPVAEIPEKIVAYRDGLDVIKIPVDADERPEDQQKALREIFTQLKLRTGHDFANGRKRREHFAKRCALPKHLPRAIADSRDHFGEPGLRGFNVVPLRGR